MDILKPGSPLFSLLYNHAITFEVHLEHQSRKILTPKGFTPETKHTSHKSGKIARIATVAERLKSFPMAHDQICDLFCERASCINVVLSTPSTNVSCYCDQRVTNCTLHMEKLEKCLYFF